MFLLTACGYIADAVTAYELLKKVYNYLKQKIGKRLSKDN